MSLVSDIKLIRTDTTLDLSQKAEKGIPLNVPSFPLCISPSPLQAYGANKLFEKPPLEKVLWIFKCSKADSLGTPFDELCNVELPLLTTSLCIHPTSSSTSIKCTWSFCNNHSVQILFFTRCMRHQYAFFRDYARALQHTFVSLCSIAPRMLTAHFVPFMCWPEWKMWEQLDPIMGFNILASPQSNVPLDLCFWTANQKLNKQKWGVRSLILASCHITTKML
jgi:hypothetical protein